MTAAYLTPAQLKTMNLGVDLSAWTDVQLAKAIQRAAAAVNYETNAPQGHDFRGASVVGETHTWPLDDYNTNPTRKVFPYHRPLIAITLMRIYATPTQYVEFNASELYYERSENWVEPASANLTSYGLWGAAMYPAIGLSEPHSKIDYTYGNTYPIAERIYPDTVTNQWRASVGFWTADPVTVAVNGTPRTTNFTVDRTEGTILFSVSIPSPTDTVDITATGSLHPDIALATGIIAADRIAQKNLLAAGFPAGVRSFHIAEVAVERDTPRRLSSSQVEPSSIPLEAQELLEQFRFMSLAFA